MIEVEKAAALVPVQVHSASVSSLELQKPIYKEPVLSSAQTLHLCISHLIAEPSETLKSNVVDNQCLVSNASKCVNNIANDTMTLCQPLTVFVKMDTVKTLPFPPPALKAVVATCQTAWQVYNSTSPVKTLSASSDKMIRAALSVPSAGHVSDSLNFHNYSAKPPTTLSTIYLRPVSDFAASHVKVADSVALGYDSNESTGYNSSIPISPIIDVESVSDISTIGDNTMSHKTYASSFTSDAVVYPDLTTSSYLLESSVIHEPITAISTTQPPIASISIIPTSLAVKCKWDEFC